MFTYSLIVLVFWFQVREYAIAQSDTTRNLPLRLINRDKQNCSEIAEEIDKKQIININGPNTFHVGQQIFYLYDEQHLKRLLSHDKRTKKVSDDYIVTSDVGIHKFHSRKRTWNDARKSCIEEGGHLAVINSASEEKVLLHMLENKNLSIGWLGLHDLYQEGDWVTVLDESLESTGYTRWSTKWPNEPDNFAGNQNCAILVDNGGMADMECTSVYPFFCEIPL